MNYHAQKVEADAELALDGLAALDFRMERYASVYADGGLVSVVLPDGEALPINGHASAATRRARAEFIAGAINSWLRRLNGFPECPPKNSEQEKP